MSSSGIKKIATGDVKAEDATLMKLCCDKVKPDKCCSGVLGDPAKVQYGGPARNYSTAERESLCMAVDTCAHKEYSANDTGLADCASKPWSFEKVTQEFHTNTLSCAVLGGNSTEMGRWRCEKICLFRRFRQWSSHSQTREGWGGNSTGMGRWRCEKNMSVTELSLMEQPVSDWRRLGWQSVG